MIRAKRNVLARSNIGTFFSNRQSRADDYNRVAGARCHLRRCSRTPTSRAFSPGRGRPGRTGDVLRRPRQIQLVHGSIRVVRWNISTSAPTFSTTSGSSAAATFSGRTSPRSGSRGLACSTSETSSSAPSWSTLTDSARRLLTREQIFQATSRWQSDDALRFNVDGYLRSARSSIRDCRRRHAATGRLQLPRAVRRRRNRRQAVAVRPCALHHRTSSTRESGTAFRVAPAFKPSSILSFETSYEMNDVTLPQGAFTTHVVNARVNVNPSNRWLTTTLVQYDSASHRQIHLRARQLHLSSGRRRVRRRQPVA